MRTKALLLFVSIGLIVNSFGQNRSLELTFTGIDNNTYAQLDSIKIENRTQDGDTVLYWPDTVLTLNNLTGITELHNMNNLQVFQNFPNPVIEKTTISIYLPKNGEINIIITDIAGRMLIHQVYNLQQGYNSFVFTPGSGKSFLLTSYWKSSVKSIKIISNNNGKTLNPKLEYAGNKSLINNYKSALDIQGFAFEIGDELLYEGYSNGLSIGMLDTPATNESYTFHFKTCPGTPTVTDMDGNVYNTVQIGNQCWMRENLRVGTRIESSGDMDDDGVVEKFCYDNDPANCLIYGGLYEWDEMMQYVTTEGVQGICPQGWHIPTDEEWKTMEMELGMSQSEADDDDWRGTDEGDRMKSTNDWYLNWVGNGTNRCGFNARSGGEASYGNYHNLHNNGHWWTSSETSDDNAWWRQLSYNKDEIKRSDNNRKWWGFSVRCVKN